MSNLSIALALIAAFMCGAGATTVSLNLLNNTTQQPEEELVVSAIAVTALDQTNGLNLITDEITGCQYILVSKPGAGLSITPRMHSDGNQYCIEIPQPIDLEIDGVSMTDAFLQSQDTGFQM